MRATSDQRCAVDSRLNEHPSFTTASEAPWSGQLPPLLGFALTRAGGSRNPNYEKADQRYGNTGTQLSC